MLLINHFVKWSAEAEDTLTYNLLNLMHAMRISATCFLSSFSSALKWLAVKYRGSSQNPSTEFLREISEKSILSTCLIRFFQNNLCELKLAVSSSCNFNISWNIRYRTLSLFGSDLKQLQLQCAPKYSRG